MVARDMKHRLSYEDAAALLLASGVPFELCKALLGEAAQRLQPHHPPRPEHPADIS